MSTPAPLLSVIIPTLSAPEKLGRTLTSLASQTLPPADFQVIIAAVVEPFIVQDRVPEGFPAALQIVRQPGRGAGRGRNAGSEMARGSLLVFLDDDMEASPGFLEAHLQAHSDGDPRRVVIGSLGTVFHPQAGGRQCSWHELDLRDWWEDVFAEMARPGHRFCFTDLLSGNFSLPAELFRQVGGFHADFTCREDYELGYRLLQAGARFELCPAARSLHLDATTLKSSLARKFAEGQADIQLARHHPDVAGELAFAQQLTGLALPSRVLRGITCRAPGAGRFLSRALLPLLPLVERLKLRGAWRQLTAGLFIHAYWQGVFARTRDWDEIRALAGEPAMPPATELDLARGIPAAEAELESRAVDGARLTWNGYPLGCLPCQPGAEPLRAAHLRAWMSARGAMPLARARAVFAALDGPGASGLNFDDLVLPCTGASTISEQQLDPLQPAALAELDLAGGMAAARAAAASARQDEPLRVLLRWHGGPLGWLHLPAQPRERGPQDVIHAILSQIPSGALFTPPQPSPPVPSEAADISVIICTRGRVEMLRGCLRALASQTQPPREIIVVDNAPQDTRTVEVAREFGVQYAREDRPGLDFARNCGLHAATSAVVAYVDDDARPAADWVAALARAFQNQAVDAVTGLVAPAELATSEQCLFEWEYGGMGHGFDRRLYRRDLLTTSALLWASGFGVGANMAFRRPLLIQSNGFDPALDVGGPAGGGGDVEMFHRLVAAGGALLYEPAALVWHIHRREASALRRQITNNGRSFGAYLITCIANRSVPIADIAAFAAFDWKFGWLLRRLARPGRLPRSLVLAELWGALLSPLAYLRARRRVKAIQ